MTATTGERMGRSGRSDIPFRTIAAIAALVLIPLLVGIVVAAHSGAPDPSDVAARGQSPATAAVDASIIVLREGLEAVLILAAITASFLGERRVYRRPVMIGVGFALVAAILTWFGANAVIGVFPESAGNVLQVVTGGLAIAILLVVMNWFFHKLYWTEWIGKHNESKRDLVTRTEEATGIKGGMDRRAFWGFVLLGFSAVYREGFEVVIFLQNLQLQAGPHVVLEGVLAGFAGTLGIGFLTFSLQHKLPYKKMLIATGVLLGIVLVVMTGGTARTMVDLHWLPGTTVASSFPDWLARWLEIYPTVSSLVAQMLAAAFVLGSYFLAEHVAKQRRDAIAAKQVNAPAPVTPPAPICGAEPVHAPMPMPVTHFTARVEEVPAVPASRTPAAARGIAPVRLDLPPLNLRVPSLAGATPAPGPSRSTAGQPGRSTPGGGS